MIESSFSSSNSRNKLDLIFEKEPREVQQKLMNLLIQYNAIMKYNREEDKFEVDLLLPFKNEKQKSEFVQHFLKQRVNQTFSENPPHQETIQNISQIQRKAIDEPEHFAANTEEHILQLENDSQIEYDDSLDLTQQISEEPKIEPKVSIHKIQYLLKNRLSKAIEEVRKMKKQESFNYENEAQKEQKNPQIIEQKQKKEIVIEIQEQQGHLKRQNEEIPIQNNDISQSNSHLEESPSINHESAISYIPSQLSSQSPGNEIRIQEEEDGGEVIEEQKFISSPPLFKLEEVQNQERKNQYYLYQAGQPQQNNYQQYSQSSHQIQPQNPHPNSSIYQSSSFQYPQIIEQNMEEDDEQLFQENDQRTPSNQKSKINAQIKHKAKLYKKYHKSPFLKGSLRESRKLETASIRQKYADFLKKSQKDLEKLYRNIRKDIEKKHQALNKPQRKNGQRDNPILILDDISQNCSSEQKAFKEQVMEEYKKQIVAENSHLSSQDLVRYFRYLLQHAKALYVKGIRKGR